MVPHLTTKIECSADFLLQYFKSIEQVATSEGFGQALPSEEFTLRKRDSVLEKLESPRSPTSKSFLAPPVKPELKRSVTPDLVPDSMHDRLPEQADAGLKLDGLEAKDVPLQAMHQRVDSPQA